MKEFTYEISSELSQLPAVESFIQNAAIDCGVDDDTTYGITLTVYEATTNAIVHANRKDPAKKVRFIVEYTGRFFTVRIFDQGSGFDPARIPDPTAPENLMKDSGRGLYLMKIYADEVQFHTTDAGTEIVLRFMV